MGSNTHTHHSSQGRTKDKATKNNTKKNRRSGASSATASVKTTAATRGDGSTIEASFCQSTTASFQLNNDPSDHTTGCLPQCDHSSCPNNFDGYVMNPQGIDFSGIGSQFDGINTDPAVFDWSQEVRDGL
ncbi:hypothetical protein PFICI_10599 [Pestalotiopsis fici W106-1]|uniref:Uncharacterized protein n=1 Tax=Pestalotiopsis fici (strain W106-1 / CGMCC3.15140) TaxID=1229662 RepID=W3WZG9_PESFW|nr:uncharacterized protein PFICI_10599 [Pestalotiopsis fici W106-1]ETS78537.1 hypothetical protein PFICI_10599 [Pestalotiopsis fici W106-1]